MLCSGQEGASQHGVQQLWTIVASCLLAACRVTNPWLQSCILWLSCYNLARKYKPDNCKRLAFTGACAHHARQMQVQRRSQQQVTPRVLAPPQCLHHAGSVSSLQGQPAGARTHEELCSSLVAEALMHGHLQVTQPHVSSRRQADGAWIRP